jgi:hypothetical protein
VTPLKLLLHLTDHSFEFFLNQDRGISMKVREVTASMASATIR